MSLPVAEAITWREPEVDPVDPMIVAAELIPVTTNVRISLMDRKWVRSARNGLIGATLGIWTLNAPYIAANNISAKPSDEEIAAVYKETVNESHAKQDAHAQTSETIDRAKRVKEVENVVNESLQTGQKQPYLWGWAHMCDENGEAQRSIQHPIVLTRGEMGFADTDLSESLRPYAVVGFEQGAHIDMGANTPRPYTQVLPVVFFVDERGLKLQPYSERQMPADIDPLSDDYQTLGEYMLHDVMDLYFDVNGEIYSLQTFEGHMPIGAMS